MLRTQASSVGLKILPNPLAFIEGAQTVIFFSSPSCSRRGYASTVRMKKIPHPLPLPTPAEIDLAKTDADARKRVRNQMLRVRRRDEEIARLTAENADCLYGDMGGMDNDCAMDNYVMDDADRYVYLHHILYAHMVHTTRIVLAARGLGVYGHVSRCPEYLRGSTLHIMRKK